MNLDDLKKISQLDSGQVAKSIQLLPDQIREVLDDARLIKIPTDYSKITNVVINGMGGSNIGAGIAKSAWSDQIKVPVSIIPGYFVPHHVDKNTLYIISSYSGGTEEPLSTYREAKKRGAKIMGLTAHGNKNPLAKLMLKDNIPGYIFKAGYNPSGQPRLGSGYMIFGVAVLLAKAGLFKIKVREIEDLIASLEIWTRLLKPEAGLAKNQAKKLARELENKIPVLVGAEFTLGTIRALRNIFCESSKNFATYLSLPDLNHFAMEGLANPKEGKKNLAFVFFDSKLYHPRIQKRSQLTKEVVKKNGVKALSHELSGENKMIQSFELLQFGAWVGFYLGMLNNIDPVKIPWVDWFKQQLK